MKKKILMSEMEVKNCAACSAKAIKAAEGRPQSKTLARHVNAISAKSAIGANNAFNANSAINAINAINANNAIGAFGANSANSANNANNASATNSDVVNARCMKRMQNEECRMKKGRGRGGSPKSNAQSPRSSFVRALEKEAEARLFELLRPGTAAVRRLSRFNTLTEFNI